MNRLQKGRQKEVKNRMTNAQFNVFLELLAQLIESKAITAAEAAEIVRQAKTPDTVGKEKKPTEKPRK